MLGLFIGFVFGFLLERSQVFKSDAIVGQFLFKKYTMLKVFLSAVMVSMGVLFYFNAYECSALLRPLNLYTNFIGGALLGIGIVLSGACPGTVFAQIGAGYKDALYTFSGAIFASILYGFIEKNVLNYFARYNLENMSLYYLVANKAILCFSIMFCLFIILLILKFVESDEWHQLN